MDGAGTQTAGLAIGGSSTSTLPTCKHESWNGTSWTELAGFKCRN
jgi:hypothetical protein